MFLKNNAARLITIAMHVGDSVQDFLIAPGENPAIEVPDAAGDLDFVKALIASGSLIEVVAPKGETEDKPARKTRETKE